ncbi:hypothetical protein A7K91_14835 [Paenibacillus oryzae]|uniref:NEAT domain-containing protein n=1 Tax=Paenibacillus oryzae TaxID=1844972 RepID=A0A1A5YS02_9BACL|nr:NEAT domain-containing protein [Paenibacillus oryzae]OBR68334.1 hypothetical protein A7K91_14835 [Paenibacillus oryzae]
MNVSIKKTLPVLILTLVLSLVMMAGSAFAATSKDYRIVRADNPEVNSRANDYAVTPASVADDGTTVTLGFNTSFLFNINSLSISNDGGSTYTTYSGSTSGGVINFTFPVDDFSVNTKAKIAVSVFGLYNETYDIQIKWL